MCRILNFFVQFERARPGNDQLHRLRKHKKKLRVSHGPCPPFRGSSLLRLCAMYHIKYIYIYIYIYSHYWTLWYHMSQSVTNEHGVTHGYYLPRPLRREKTNRIPRSTAVWHNQARQHTAVAVAAAAARDGVAGNKTTTASMKQVSWFQSTWQKLRLSGSLSHFSSLSLSDAAMRRVALC